MNKRFGEITRIDRRLAKPLRMWRKEHASASPDGLTVVWNEWRDGDPEHFGEVLGIRDQNSRTAVTDKFDGIVRDWVYTVHGDLVWVIVLEF